VLALDLGDVRIGLAISDPLGITGQPLPPLERIGPRRDMARLVELVQEHEVTTVVIGLPLLLSGLDGARATEAREYSERLGRRLPAVRVELWDERLTSRQAEREMIAGGVSRKKRKKVIDGLAATLILQGYLEVQGQEDPGG
jgi:putative Holliday junction resolvase